MDPEYAIFVDPGHEKRIQELRERGAETLQRLLSKENRLNCLELICAEQSVGANMHQRIAAHHGSTSQFESQTLGWRSLEDCLVRRLPSTRPDVFPKRFKQDRLSMIQY